MAVMFTQKVISILLDGINGCKFGLKLNFNLYQNMNLKVDSHLYNIIQFFLNNLENFIEFTKVREIQFSKKSNDNINLFLIKFSEPVIMLLHKFNEI
jgi:hypothetical protein